MMQAGGLDLPTDLVLLPAPNTPNSSLNDDANEREREMFSVPDFVFLIEHTTTGNKYLFDLGMRKDLENSTPELVKDVLPHFRSYPKSPVEILRKHGTPDQQPSAVKAVIFSHLHFDHFGDFGKDGLSNAELWVGPLSCTSARPGYPVDKMGEVFSDDLPKDGSKKIVEFELSSNLLDDKRRIAISDAVRMGHYEGIELHKPASGWFGLGAFEAAFDLFNDGSVYLIDAPGHTAGHQMLLVRVKLGSNGETDDFVLLSGDCFHHPAMLADPLLTARPPFSKSSMHSNPEIAIMTMFRTKRCAEEENIWVVGSHDFSIHDTFSAKKDALKGMLLLTDWRKNGWKHQ
jgi:glyoxylase-like metal-dependent hydrolase (beta-lactamase superfamily II)